jgi:hypothetical protein
VANEKLAVEVPEGVYLPSGLFPICPTKITLFTLDFCNINSSCLRYFIVF